MCYVQINRGERYAWDAKVKTREDYEFRVRCNFR